VARDQLHRDVGPLVGEASEVVDGHDIGVIELARDLGFLDEADGGGRVGVGGLDRLHGDLAQQQAIEAAVDGPHPPASDLALVVVAGVCRSVEWRVVGALDALPRPGSQHGLGGVGGVAGDGVLGDRLSGQHGVVELSRGALLAVSRRHRAPFGTCPRGRMIAPGTALGGAGTGFANRTR
jgi:hypothetical protein